jgi:hypothetical protein
MCLCPPPTREIHSESIWNHCERSERWEESRKCYRVTNTFLQISRCVFMKSRGIIANGWEIAYKAFRSLIDLAKGTLFSAYEIASKLKWYSGPWETFSPWSVRAAMTETAAHLEYLKKEGEISRVEKKGRAFYRLVH